MASTIVLKRRIKSIKNTRQITKAMQLVSASKLRRAQEYAQASRAYAELATELLTRLSGISEVERQPLFAKREVKNRLYVVITSNSGLAGAYNANVLKQLTQGLKDDQAAKIASHVIVVGSRGAQFVRRLHGVDLLAAYPAFGDQPTANAVRPLLNTVIEQYKSEAVDDVRLLYTKFKSTVSQQALSAPLLPAQKLEGVAAENTISNFEPDVETVVDQVAIRLIEAQIWQIVAQYV